MTRDWKKLYKHEAVQPCEMDPHMKYSDIALDHYSNPRNVGRLEEYDGLGKFGEPNCSDFLEITIKLDDNDHIVRIGFLMYGCAGAISTTSIMTELVKGRHISQAMELTDAEVISALGGFPESKAHCSLLGIRALHFAIIDVLQFRKLKDQGVVTNLTQYREFQKQGKIRPDGQPANNP